MLVQYLFCPVFRNRSMFLDMQSEKAPEFRKDTVYRLKNSTHIDWKRFTTLLAPRIIRDTIVPLTSEDRRNAFIVDDSIYERRGSKKVELLAKVYDHASHRYTQGFRMLTLGWSDGVTFLPVNSCLLSSEKESSRINEGWDDSLIHLPMEDAQHFQKLLSKLERIWKKSASQSKMKPKRYIRRFSQ